jgi:serine phosphatase RsbU (regulator of sigma subunit)
VDIVQAENLKPPSEQVREVSRLIQRGLVPREVPRVDGFDIAAGTSLEPDGAARTVWSHFRMKDETVGLAALLVTGDGLPPGHLLALAGSLLKELAQDREGLEGLLARVNGGLAAAVPEGSEQYVEAGILLPSEAGVEWAGAGRGPGAVIRRGGVFDEFSAHGPPLGMLEGFLYSTERKELGAGDAVVVLSEGASGIFRGAADLVATLQGKPVAEIVGTVQRALKKAPPGGAVESSVLFLRKQ